MRVLRPLSREPVGQRSNAALLQINECIRSEALALRKQLNCLREALEVEEGEFFVEMLDHVDQRLETLRGFLEVGISTRSW